MTTLSALVLFGAISLSSGFLPEALLFQQGEKQEQHDEYEKKAQSANEILRKVTRNEIDIVFIGNRVFSQQEWIGALVHFNHSAIKIYEWDDLSVDLRSLRLLVGKEGYLQAGIGKPVIENVGERVRITIAVNEGLPYRIGKLSVKGATLFSEAKILELFGMKSGEIARLNKIHEGLYQKIKDAYEEYGYVHASAEFIPDFKPALPWSAEAIVDLIIEVEEGKQFLIDSIDFEGLPGENYEWLRSEIYLAEGDIYNKRALDNSIVRLNQLGLFEKIKGKDVVTRTNDRNCTINLLFQLKKKED